MELSFENTSTNKKDTLNINVPKSPDSPKILGESSPIVPNKDDTDIK